MSRAVAADDAPLLERFRSRGVLSPLDVHFARTVGRVGGERNERVLLAAALACRAPRHGHICIEPRRVATTVRLEPAPGEAAAPLPWPEPEAWLAVLRTSPLVAGEGLARNAAAPLVLQGDRLYLDRYFRYEERLVAAIRARLACPAEEIDEELLRDGLGRLFAAPSPGGAGRAGGAAGGEVEGASPAEPDRQKLGAELAVRGRFTVISGGPGTGKTTTVKKILVLLLEQARRLHQLGRGPFPLRIGLLAPTGKAAARLSEAIHEGLAELEVRPRELLDHLPVEASTVHRALGVIPDRPTLFRHGPDNPLPLDVVVVDEASMVDFALMTKLVEAVPSRARLILLGDSDQLASVEAGAVLGDICRGAGAGAEAEAGAGAEAEAGAGAEAEAGSGSATWGRPAGGSEGQAIGDRVIQLTRGWRFGPQSGIGALARAVNGDRPDDALALLRGQRREQGAPEPEPGGHTDLRLLDGAPEQVLEEQLRPLVVAGYAAFLAAAAARRDAAAALAALGRFRVLCAHRRGRLGVEQLGRRIEGWLAAAGLIEPEAGSWYAGRPILVTRNDYVLRLFNGDTGVVVPAPEGGGSLHACFPGARPGEVRRLAPARLPPHETVFAMTVHKSQGSQFEEVLIVLPEQPSPVLTRELLYTAVTRAGTMVTLAGEEPVIRHAIGERVQRFSGLRGKLWGSTSGFDWALGFD